MTRWQYNFAVLVTVIPKQKKKKKGLDAAECCRNDLSTFWLWLNLGVLWNPQCVIQTRIWGVRNASPPFSRNTVNYHLQTPSPWAEGGRKEREAGSRRGRAGGGRERERKRRERERKKREIRSTFHLLVPSVCSTPRTVLQIQCYR